MSTKKGRKPKKKVVLDVKEEPAPVPPQDEDAKILASRLSKVVKVQAGDEKIKPTISETIIIMHPSQRMTIPYMSIYEFTEVIAQRAAQLTNKNELRKEPITFTDIGNLSDAIKIARKEILDKKCPLSIRRKISENPYTHEIIVEEWSVNELGIPAGEYPSEF